MPKKPKTPAKPQARPEKTVNFGDKSAQIVGGQDVLPVAADVLVEVFAGPQHMALGFASLTSWQTPEGPILEAIICSRLRLGYSMAVDLHAMLGKVLEARRVKVN